MWSEATPTSRCRSCRRAIRPSSSRASSCCSWTCCARRPPRRRHAQVADQTWDLVHDRADDDPVKQRVVGMPRGPRPPLRAARRRRRVSPLSELFDRRVKARSLAYLFAAGAATGLLTLVLPHDESVQDLQLVILALVARRDRGRRLLACGGRRGVGAACGDRRGHDHPHAREPLRRADRALPGALHVDGRCTRSTSSTCARPWRRCCSIGSGLRRAAAGRRVRQRDHALAAGRRHAARSRAC